MFFTAASRLKKKGYLHCKTKLGVETIVSYVTKIDVSFKCTFKAQTKQHLFVCHLPINILY